MGRFSPTVRPSNAPSFGQLLLEAVNTGFDAYDSAKARKVQEKEQSIQSALRDMQLAERGVHMGNAPTAPRPMTPGVDFTVSRPAQPQESPMFESLAGAQVQPRYDDAPVPGGGVKGGFVAGPHGGQGQAAWNEKPIPGAGRPGAFNPATMTFNPAMIQAAPGALAGPRAATTAQGVEQRDGYYIDHEAIKRRESQAFQKRIQEAILLAKAEEEVALPGYRARKAIDAEYREPPAPPAPKSLMQVDRGNVIELADPVTGEPRRTVPKAQSPGAGAASGQRDFSNAAQLRSQYNGEQAVKDATQVSAAYSTVRSALTQGTAAGDMAGIFAFMKAMDPGSTVREGEYANAQNAAGVPERIRNAFNKAKDGQILDQNQRKDFLTTMEQMVANRRKALDGVNQRYSQIASRWQVDPRDVVYDPFSASDLTPEDQEAAANDPEFAQWLQTRKP